MELPRFTMVIGPFLGTATLTPPGPDILTVRDTFERLDDEELDLSPAEAGADEECEDVDPFGIEEERLVNGTMSVFTMV